MPNPNKVIFNVATGESITVEMTDEEVAAREARASAAEAAATALAEEQAAKESLKASARAKLVAGEALTEEEAATIVI